MTALGQIFHEHTQHTEQSEMNNMGYELLNHKQMKMMNYNTWYWLLNLAMANGWKATGTEAPEGGKSSWSGSYTGNDGQTVGAIDAKAFASALRVALARGDLSDGGSGDELEGIVDWTHDQLPQATKQKLRLLREVSGPWNPRSYVEEIADFADEGAFLHW